MKPLAAVLGNVKKANQKGEIFWYRLSRYALEILFNSASRRNLLEKVEEQEREREREREETAGGTSPRESEICTLDYRRHYYMNQHQQRQ